MDNTKIKILIAEDEESLREMLALVLKDEDYQVDEAVDGLQAWSLLNKNHYDLLVTDLFMPKMNGFELIIKCHEFFTNTRTILLSGGGKEIEAEHGNKYIKYLDQKTQVDAYLKKPCSLSEFLSTIEKIL